MWPSDAYVCNINQPGVHSADVEIGKMTLTKKYFMSADLRIGQGYRNMENKSGYL